MSQPDSQKKIKGVKKALKVENNEVWSCMDLFFKCKKQKRDQKVIILNLKLNWVEYLKKKNAENTYYAQRIYAHFETIITNAR